MRGWCIRRGAGFSIASFSGAFASLLQLFFSFSFSAVCFPLIVICSFLLFMFLFVLLAMVIVRSIWWCAAAKSECCVIGSNSNRCI